MKTTLEFSSEKSGVSNTKPYSTVNHDFSILYFRNSVRTVKRVLNFVDKERNLG